MPSSEAEEGIREVYIGEIHEIGLSAVSEGKPEALS